MISKLQNLFISFSSNLVKKDLTICGPWEICWTNSLLSNMRRPESNSWSNREFRLKPRRTRNKIQRMLKAKKIWKNRSSLIICRHSLSKPSLDQSTAFIKKNMKRERWANRQKKCKRTWRLRMCSKKLIDSLSMSWPYSLKNTNNQRLTIGNNCKPSKTRPSVMQLTTNSSVWWLNT